MTTNGLRTMLTDAGFVTMFNGGLMVRRDPSPIPDPTRNYRIAFRDNGTVAWIDPTTGDATTFTDPTDAWDHMVDIVR